MCKCTLAKIPKEELKDFKNNYGKVMKFIFDGSNNEDQRAGLLKTHITGKLDKPLERFIGNILPVNDRAFNDNLEYALNEGTRQEGTEPRPALDYATELLRSFLRKHT